jgi:hypothetical protein
MLPILLAEIPAQGEPFHDFANAWAAFVVFLLLGVAGVAIYFLPTAIAIINGSRNLAAIFFLNLLTGWTFIGWVAAFVWAWVR